MITLTAYVGIAAAAAWIVWFIGGHRLQHTKYQMWLEDNSHEHKES